MFAVAFLRVVYAAYEVLAHDSPFQLARKLIVRLPCCVAHCHLCCANRILAKNYRIMPNIFLLFSVLSAFAAGKSAFASLMMGIV